MKGERGERVRYWVDRRLTTSERPPVRHKSYPVLDSDRWIRKKQEEKKSGRFLGGLPDPDGIGIVSFLFRNFPGECELNRLRSKFGEFSEVVDIFCPRKRDKAGKWFGFVRFWEKKVPNVDRALEFLNNLWIGSYKLQVFKPRFERNQPRTLNQAKSFPITNATRRVPGISYKEAVAGKQQPVESLQKDESFSFETLVEEKEWLEECWVTLLKEFSWNDIGEEVQAECGNWF
ncbi:hypothetical protein ACS0TY_000509 [Phlomoides rotata]